MTRSTCERWIAVSDRLALGEPLASDERAFQREHEMECTDCRAEAGVWAALGRARVDDRALSEAEAWCSLADEGLSGAAAGPRPAASRPKGLGSNNRRLRSALVLAGVALVAVAAAVPFGLRQFRPPPSVVPVSIADLVLAAGNVELDARSAMAGTALTAEQTLRVGEGHACVRLEPGIAACMAGSSAMRVTAPGSHDRALSLLSGAVLAKLERQPPGSTFRIDTTRGSAIAKGTIFSVQIATDARVLVRVQEGTVVFRASNGRETRLVAPVQASIGAEVALTPMTASAEDDALLQLMRLSPPQAKARLDVTSSPAGAMVTLDGAELGVSPLSALVSGGQRLSLARAGYSAVSERVWLAGAERISRSYELVPAPEPSRSPEPALDASAATLGAAGPAVRGQPPGPVGEPNGLSAEELLARARSLRAAGRSAEAAAAYRRVISAWPRSPEARVGLMTLAELELSELSEPAAALRDFSAYLRFHGTLAPEARYGKIRALGRLGRHAEELSEAREFVLAYPNSVQASDLRARLGL